MTQREYPLTCIDLSENQMTDLLGLVKIHLKKREKNENLASVSVLSNITNLLLFLTS